MLTGPKWWICTFSTISLIKFPIFVNQRTINIWAYWKKCNVLRKWEAQDALEFRLEHNESKFVITCRRFSSLDGVSRQSWEEKKV